MEKKKSPKIPSPQITTHFIFSLSFFLNKGQHNWDQIYTVLHLYIPMSFNTSEYILYNAAYIPQNVLKALCTVGV